MQQVLIKNARVGTVMSLSRTISVLAELKNASGVFLFARMAQDFAPSEVVTQRCYAVNRSDGW
jgi:hypothetical protein